MKPVHRGTSLRARQAARGPGRPLQDLNTYTVILDVAERLFARLGYVGTSMRMIADSAAVTQALITYYFGSKERLFEAVFKRRGLELAARRHALLDELLARRAKPTVEALVRAYVAPQFDLKKSGPGGLSFVRIQARLHNEPEELAFRLRRDVYDDSTKRYIKALGDVLPKVSAADINFRMMFMIGTYLYMISDVSRLDELSDGSFNTAHQDEVLERMVQFLKGGICAPTTPGM